MKVTSALLLVLAAATVGYGRPQGRSVSNAVRNPIPGLVRQPKMDLLGITCAACTVIAGVTDQLAEVHSESYGKALQRFCNALPSPYGGLCGAFRLLFGIQITNSLNKGETPDTTCIKMKLCKAPENGAPVCHLYPTKQAKGASADEVQARVEQLIRELPAATRQVDPRLNICDIPLLGNLICGYLNVEAFAINLPAEDDDEDGFSDKRALRGSDWRGKDCNDRNDDVYPGRKSTLGDFLADSNCNGIYGKDPESDRPFEEVLCDNTDSKGIVVLGDSVAANFHVPGEWFNASMIHADLFKNLTYMMDNSLNWPHTSVYTGFENVTWSIIDGTTDSIYLRMRDRNLCNHRDYQNLGVNGATMLEANGFAQHLRRDSKDDKPSLVIFAYIGNDVCDYDVNNIPHSLDQMTTAAEARVALVETLTTLDRKLAPGSHVVVIGVADARPFFAGIHDQIHPFGSLRRDVTYNDFYTWLSCLDINPCPGWLTRDDRIHNYTAQRVYELNEALEKTVAEYKNRFQNLQPVYLANPIYEVIARQEALGGQGWQLVEKFDGFHPNQKGHKLLAEVAWEAMEKTHPHILGPVNPNNNRIRTLFGDQGGHV